MRSVPFYVLICTLTAAQTAGAQDRIFNRETLAKIAAAQVEAPRDPSTPVKPDDAMGGYRSTWIGRHPVLVGTLIGAGVGAIMGRSGINLAVGTAVGAGAGALGTAVFTSARGRASYAAPPGPSPVVTTDVTAVRTTVTKLGINQRVVVVTRDARRLEGRLVTVGGDEFSLQAGTLSDSVTVSYAEVTSVRRKSLGTGVKAALVGGVIGGIALGWLACYGAGGCGGVS